MDARERDLRKLGKKNGLVVVRRRKHFILVDKDTGQVVATASVSGSDHRGMKNLAAHIRRYKNSR